MTDKKWRIWRVILWVSLVYATQHLIRDILSDILGIHNTFTEFLHRESANAKWCGDLCKWTTFPVEIFYIISSTYLLKKKRFGLLGRTMTVLGILILLQYLDLVIK